MKNAYHSLNNLEHKFSTTFNWDSVTKTSLAHDHDFTATTDFAHTQHATVRCEVEQSSI